MRFRYRYALAVAPVLLVSLTTAATSAQSRLQQPSPQQVARQYFAALNAGMKSSDFSALATVYAPDATLTWSNPLGVTTVVHGRAALTRFYQGVRAKFPGLQWATTSWHSVAPTVVIFYERAGTPGMAAPGRCAHTIVVQNGKITSIDWVTYYPGKQ